MTNGATGQKPSSTAGAVGRGLGVLYRNLTRKQNRDLMVKGGDRLAKGVVAGGTAFAKATARAANTLFLEVMGLIFVVMGVGFAGRAVALYFRQTNSQNPQRDLVILTLIGIMFIYFGITSFWKARKK